MNGMAACLCQPGYMGTDCQTGGWQERAPGRDSDAAHLGKLPSHPASPLAIVLGGERSALLVVLTLFSRTSPSPSRASSRMGGSG